MKTKLSTIHLAVILPIAMGCTTKLVQPRYFQAQAQPEPQRVPAVVKVPEPLPLPGQLRRYPTMAAASAAPADTCLTDPPDPRDKKRSKRNHERCNDVASVIADANKKAAQNPEHDGYFNAIQTWPYEEGALYQIYSAPMRLTVISLQPGEKIMGRPAAGDTTRWQASIGKSLNAGVEQLHIYVKPSRPGLDTSMVITTDRRTYFLELHSFETEYLAAASWRYPQDEIAQLETEAVKAEVKEKAVSATIDLSAAYFGYDISVSKGRPRWTPEQVFDDGAKTYIRFPKSMMAREAPALFVLSGDKDVQLVNYRVRNEYYVVDRLFDVAELRLGQQSQDIVRITRK
jgi:P-type conjugative transfer protein TrbG